MTARRGTLLRVLQERVDNGSRRCWSSLYMPDYSTDPILVVLEDTWRPAGVKVAGATAIPLGVYQVRPRTPEPPRLTAAARALGLPTPVPHLEGVLGFSSVFVHWGNTEGDTLGCPLVGLIRAGALLLRSRDAYAELMKEWILPAWDLDAHGHPRGEVHWEIVAAPACKAYEDPTQ